MLHILRLCCNVHVASIRTGLEICWLATYSNCKCWLATYSNCKCWLATYFNWKCWLATYSNCKWFLNLEFLLLFQKIFIWNIRFTILEIFVQNVVAIGFQFVLRVFELLVKIINNCNSFIYCLRLILYLLHILQIHVMATLRCPHSVNILGYVGLLIYHKRFLSSDSFSKVWRLCIWLFSVN